MNKVKVKAGLTYVKQKLQPVVAARPKVGGVECMRTGCKVEVICRVLNLEADFTFFLRSDEAG